MECGAARTTSAGFPSAKVGVWGTTQIRAPASADALNPVTDCSDTVACQPTNDHDGSR